MRPAPDLPALILLQAVSTSAPTGVTRPSPVTTTRRMAISSIHLSKRKRPPDTGSESRLAISGVGLSPPKSGLVRVDVADRILDRGDLLGRIVRDLHAE